MNNSKLKINSGLKISLYDQFRKDKIKENKDLYDRFDLLKTPRKL